MTYNQHIKNRKIGDIIDVRTTSNKPIPNDEIFEGMGFTSYQVEEAMVKAVVFRVEGHDKSYPSIAWVDPDDSKNIIINKWENIEDYPHTEHHVFTIQELKLILNYIQSSTPKGESE